MPALSGRNHVRRALRQSRIFGARLAVVDLHTSGTVDLACLRQHARCKVEPNHSAAAAGKAAGERSSACAEVYHPLSSMADAMGGETIEERAGKPRAMAAVVFGGRGEV